MIFKNVCIFSNHLNCFKRIQLKYATFPHPLKSYFMCGNLDKISKGLVRSKISEHVWKNIIWVSYEKKYHIGILNIKWQLQEMCKYIHLFIFCFSCSINDMFLIFNKVHKIQYCIMILRRIRKTHFYIISYCFTCFCHTSQINFFYLSFC